MWKSFSLNFFDRRDTHQTTDNPQALGVIGLLVFLPLIPAAFNQGYEQIKVLFFLGFTTLIGAGWVWSSFTHPDRFKIKNSSIQLGLVVFLLTLLATSAIGQNFQASLLGNPPYFQGLLVYIYCYIWFLIISTIPLKHQAIYLSWVTSSLAVAVVALFQWSLIHLGQIPLPAYAGRVISTFGQPSLYSGYLLLTLPILIVLINRATGKLKKLYITGLVLIILAIVASESRGAILLSGGLFFLWIWDKLKHPLIRYGMIFGIITLLGLGVVSILRGDGILNQEVIRPLLGSRVGEEGQERRVYIWLFALDLIQNQPIVGYGLDNLVQVFPLAMTELNPKPPFYYTVKDMTVDRAHNYLLDLLISGGVVVFFAWMAWYFLLISHAKSRWELVFLGVFFIYLQFQIQSITHLVFFYTVAGLINRYDREIKAPS